MMTMKTASKAAPKSSKAAAKGTATPVPKVVKKRAAKTASIPSPVTPSEAAPAAASARPQRGKLAQIIALLERDKGATLIDLMATTGWQPHSVRGALSTLKKKLGQSLHSAVNADGLRQYRLETK